ncbi:MAG TPA: divalent metal cation transporter [Thermoflexia bacterium]|nr:MAG: divalent metal cation transporter [Chloroflexota bacterium]HEY66853.1 divalent metal cation transporter [Thermoflexia bacterium]
MTLKAGAKRAVQRALFYLAIIGPGLITASADNDAPGIATYSMAGSTYGYAFLWMILAVTVGEMVVQEMAARMGAMTGKGLADLIRERFGVKVTAFAMLCLLLANFGTTVAQFAGIAAGMELLGISRYLAVPTAALLVWLLVTRGSYSRVEKFLLALCLASLSYVVCAFLVRPPWDVVLRRAVTPAFHLETDYVLALLATLGTTITPWGCVYLQASIVDKGVTPQEYRYTRLDVVTGVAFGNIISAFVVICTAATLFVHGIQVETAEQAALALAPLAGPWAKYLFSVGLLGASLLAASVLPLSTTYAMCEAFGWERGTDNRPREAPVFYGLYTAVVVLGAALVLLPGVPLFPLMWLSQTLNAILLPVLLVLMLRLANDRHLMGEHRNSRVTNVLAWGLTGLIVLITVILFTVPLWPAS